MKNILTLYASRDTYGKAESAQRTMTAGELREFLDQFDDKLPIILAFDGGYTYGKILERRFEEEEYTEED